MAESVVLGTFNIRHGLTAEVPQVVDPDGLARACAALGADVLGLQEVDRQARRSGRVDLAAVAAGPGRATHAFGPAKRLGWLGRYGNALLVRGELTDVGVRRLTRLAGRERRAALLATARVGGRDLSVAVAHLGVRQDESERQLVEVVEALLARPLPRVLLGDLNRREDQIGALATAGFTIATGGPTFPAAAPRTQIDHVAVQGLEIVRTGVVETPVSDHRALIVEVV